MRFRHANTVADLDGETYFQTLDHIHKTLRPTTYFEIGTLKGESLQYSNCHSLAVDPEFCFGHDLLESLMKRTTNCFYRMTADEFFKSNNPINILGRPIDLAFLDGMHLCDFLLRDFYNTERFCSRSATIMLHDCLPVEAGIAERHGPQASRCAPHRAGWWTGDVWRTALLLKRRRPDLRIRAFDAYATGLVLIDNLDPTSSFLSDHYSRLVTEMLSWSYDDIGIAGLERELDVKSTSTLY